MGHYYRRELQMLRCQRCNRRLIAPLLFDATLLYALCPDCSVDEADNPLPVFSLAA